MRLSALSWTSAAVDYGQLRSHFIARAAGGLVGGLIGQGLSAGSIDANNKGRVLWFGFWLEEAAATSVILSMLLLKRNTGTDKASLDGEK